MQKQKVIIQDLGVMDYQQAWNLQEQLLKENVEMKSAGRRIYRVPHKGTVAKPCTELSGAETGVVEQSYVDTTEIVNYLLFVEHPPVYTLGKSGHIENLLISEEERAARGIQFFKTNRGGDITFHGPGQIVGYPILDLEKFYTDIGKYLRNIEEVIILTLAEYGIKGERSTGETGVWIDAAVKGMERKICAIGVRCSRWITMHGFAFNVNTDLDYFNFIIPCGIRNKKVTSLFQETGAHISVDEVKIRIKKNFQEVFQVEIPEQSLDQKSFGI